MQTPNSKPGRDIHFNRNGRFHTRDGLFVWDGLSLWWFVSDRYYLLIWMNNPPDFIRPFRRTVWRRDYPFQIACVQPSPSLRKNRRRGVCGEGATVHMLVSDGKSISSFSVKTANNKIPVCSVFNDNEGLYRTTLCHCLVRRPHYSARLMRFGSRGPSEFATEMPWPRLRGKTPYRD